MSKEKNANQAENTEDKADCCDTKEKVKKDIKRELETSKKHIEELEKELENQKTLFGEANDKYLRLAAEFDNFKKRSQKEKDGIYADAVCDTVEKLLAVLDNLERACAFDTGNQEAGEDAAVTTGISMISKQFVDILEKMGVTVIPTDIPFDPNLHNAVMHEENPELSENVITDVFMKGYQLNDKVIRYSVVKVAN